ncbi:hypothetical protein SRABI123_00137 [Pseudomonas sp. Bi123]|jgi:hypothetical protein|uniref:Uncharacterized protein n=1 Tax=Pseudomonas frederiksbergensis TaxID=104087 RepID=A0AB33EHK8_9PSED|nr:hypothetical protein CNN82_18880 [Pseudomonas frederiksbergensis]CAH0127624.1 hypothetical protein SRABI123_00137 [Pseudomonas sp. Bi123]
MTTPPIDESTEEPEQLLAHQHSSSGLSELTTLELPKQEAQQTDVVPVALTVILWRSLMLKQ